MEREVSEVRGGPCEFSPGSVVQLAVSHVRVMDGEGDVCLLRRRSVAAERAVSDCISRSGCGDPAWFDEAWDGERLVVTIVWDGEDGARRFRESFVCCDDASIVSGGEDDAARRFGEEWTRQHDALMEKVRSDVSGASDESLLRCVVGSAACEGFSDGNRPESAAMSAVMGMVGDRWASRLEGNDRFAYSVMADVRGMRVVFGFILPGISEADEFCTDMDGIGVGYVRGSGISGSSDESFLQTAAGLLRRAG